MGRPPIVVLSVLCACLIGCGVSGGAIIGGTFANTGSDTATRFFHRATLLSDGKVIVSGGMTLQIFPPSLVSLKSISFYNPATGTFSSSFTPTGGGPAVTPQLATARSSHTQTTLPDGRVLVTGGRTAATGTNPGTAVDSVEIFSPVTGLLTAGPTMNETRAGHTATLISDGRVVIIGGFTWQIFNSATNTFSPAISLAYSRLDHAAVRLPDHFGAGSDGILIVAGAGSGGTRMELINPAAGTTIPMNSMLSIPVDDLSADLLDNGLVLIVGGQNLGTGNTILDTYLFDPATDELMTAPSPPNIPDGISDHRSIALGRYVAIFGGESQVSGADTELTYAAIYDRAANAWIFQSNMINPHDDFPAVLLNDGRILLIGGGAPLFGNEAPTSACELFTPTNILPGDVNGDSIVSELDIPPFKSVLLDPASANTSQYCAADINEDFSLDGRDVARFIDLLIGS